MEERAILFIDQVGSTRQLAESGDEAMVAVVERLWSILQTAETTYEGQIFSDEGDGGAMAFLRLNDAINAAFAIMSESRDANIVVRAGVHVGPVIPHGSGFIGLTVHLAARICDAAPANYVMATDAVAAGHDSTVARVTAFGHRSLKGIPDPVAVHLVTESEHPPPPVTELERVAHREPMASSPLLLTHGGALVGRDRELQQVLGHATGTNDGPRLTLVAGEPGSGKSAVAHRATQLLEAEGAVCLVGRADEQLDDPLQEFVEAVTHLAHVLPTSVLAAHVLRHGDVLTRLLPGLGDRLPTGATDATTHDFDRRRLFDAIVDLLHDTSRLQPIVILLEDLQWATNPTLDLIHHLLSHRNLDGVFLVGTYRDTDVAPGGTTSDFLGKVGGRTEVDTISIDPLSISDLETLVDATVPHSLPDQQNFTRRLAQQIEARTGGNALFSTEILRHLDTDALIQADPDEFLETVAIPTSVQELVRRRADHLGSAASSVLASAAVLGENFSTRPLVGMVDDADLFGALDAAERAGLVRSGDELGEHFSFTHALMQEALYSRLSTADRVRRHRRAADALTANGGDTRAAEVLGHLQRCGVLATSSEIIEQATTAAVDASERLALREAAAFHEVAVAELRASTDTTPLELASALFELAKAQTAAADRRAGPTMVEAAEQARAAGDHDLFASIAVGYGGPLKENQAFYGVDEPVALITEALTHHGEPDATRARLLLTQALWQRQRNPLVERRALADEAMAIVRTLDDDRALAAILAERHRALHGPDAADEAIGHAAELAEVANRLDDDLLRFQAVNIRLLAHYALGHWEASLETATELADLGARLRNIEGQRLTIMWEALSASIRGDWKANHRGIRRTAELLENSPADVVGRFSTTLGFIRVWFSGAVEAMYELTPPQNRVEATAAWFAAEAGKHDAARGHLEASGGIERTLAQSDYMFWHDIVSFTRAAKALGDPTLAEETYAAALPFRQHNAVMGLIAFLGGAEHHLGTLAVVAGRAADAEAHFEAAIAQHEAMGAEPFLALSRAELANLLGSTPRADELRVLAREAADRLELGVVTEELARG